MIEQLLAKLDFNKNEIAVYLEVIRHGKVSPTRIAALTGVNRTTVYGIAKKLAKIGMIVEDLGGRSHYLTALPPENLKSVLKKDEDELECKRRMIGEAVAELAPLVSKVSYSVPKIHFVEEESLQDYLIKRTPEWLESAGTIDNTAWGYRDHTLLESYPKWLEFYWEVAPKAHVVKLLSNRADVEKRLLGKYPRRHNKYWDKVQNFSVTMWVLGEFVIMVMTRQRPHYLIEIHDVVFAQNQRELFKGIWEELGEMKYE